MSKSAHLGSSFEDYLREDGNADAINAIALKRVIAWQIQNAMEENKISKAQLAKVMRTSRSQLDRILDPEHPGIQLDTMQKVARVLGYRLRLELVK